MDSDFSYYGLHEQPGSGTVFGNGKTEYIFKGIVPGTAARAFADLRGAAACGDLFRGDYIQFSECKYSRDGVMETLFVVTAPCIGKTAAKDRAEGETEYALNINDMEKPLEMHPNYRTNWNYDLFAAVEATAENLKNPQISSSPAWWLTATTTNIPPEEQLKYKWGKSAPPDQTVKENGISKTYRWLMAIPRTKPGQEVFPYAAPVVTERIFFRTRSRAEDNLRKANTHVAPKKTYIYSKNPKNWVVKPSGIEESGGYFITVNTYIYADKWDEDFYNE